MEQDINRCSIAAGPPQRQVVLRIALIAVAYFLAHQLAFLFPDSEKVIMAVWPAGGIGLAALLLNPRRLWPALVVSFYIAGVLADLLLAGRSFFASVGYMTGNMVESLGCAWLILRWSEDRVRFARVNEVLALIAGTIGINAFSACIGAGTATLSRGVSFGNSWLSWYVSDGLGVLLIAPLIVSWLDIQDLRSCLRGRWLVEWGVFLIVWCTVGWRSFQPNRAFSALSSHPYTLVALLAWPALRSGQRAVTLALVVLAGIAVTSESVRLGPLPWGGGDMATRLLAVQAYLGITAIAGLLLAAVHAEHKQAEAELARHRDHLEELVEQRTREMEAAREQARQADRLSSLGTFAAGIAHEINNPLGMMLLGTDSALACIDKPEAVARLLQQNKALIQRCAHIAQGVLDFSRKQAVEKLPLDLNEVVRHGVDLAREFGAEHGVTVETCLAEALSPISATAVELEQVVVNLVHNAVQACGKGGHVTVETQEVGAKVRLVVRDDGCGMPPEQMQRVFDPFYTTRLEKGGTGLGLSVVHGIVADHNGTIKVASETGRGTTFTVEFGRHTETEPVDGKRISC